MTVWRIAVSMAGFAAALALGAGPALALISYAPVRGWPESWPSEFNDYRDQAVHITPMTGGASEEIYEIHFNDREEFERLWPAVLKVKTEGAPLTLRTFEPIEDHPMDGDIFTKPYLTIHVPPSNSPRKLETVRLPSGEPAEYAQLREDAWHPLEPGETGHRTSGYSARARTDVALHVDGTVIDLNRIPLPGNTPIVDKRELPK